MRAGERELKWGGKNRVREREGQTTKVGEREEGRETTSRSRYSHKFASIHPASSSTQ